jgi:serine/threonine-protein kinase RIO1
MMTEKLSEMINRRIRVEKIAIKDVKMRTFITEDASRNEMVQHVYDITYGTVRAMSGYAGGDRRFHSKRHYTQREHHPNAGKVSSPNASSLYPHRHKSAILIAME